MRALLLANMRGAGLLYVTNDTSPNPYDSSPFFLNVLSDFFDTVQPPVCIGLNNLGLLQNTTSEGADMRSDVLLNDNSDLQ